MQYLLSEEEYRKLTGEAQLVREEYSRLVGKLCQQVADHKPVEGWHAEHNENARDGKAPWGCRHTADRSHGRYCDNCPVRDVCTLSRDFSK